MNPVAVGRRYTFDDLASMRRKDPYELYDGKLRRVVPGEAAHQVAVRLAERIANFLTEHPYGEVVPVLTGLQIFPMQPDRVLRVDGDFISHERLSAVRGRDISSGFLTVAPELIIESISRGERANYMHWKQMAYFDAGVRMVWMVSADNRGARSFRPHIGRWMTHDGYLDGEDVLPGFRCALTDIMPPADDDADHKGGADV